MSHLTLNDLKVYNASATERFILDEYGIECFVEVIHRSQKKKSDRNNPMIKIFKIQFVSARSMTTFIISLINVVDFSVSGNEVKIKLTK